MLELFTIENLFTLAMLILLQAVLGFDNLLYISIESKRVEASRQAFVRKFGISLAIILRIILLFVIVNAIYYLQDPFLEFGLQEVENGGGAEAAEAASPAEGEDGENEHSEQRTYALTSSGKFVACSFNVHSIIVLVGGIFIIYTAFKEIFHLLSIDNLEGEGEREQKRSVGKAVFWITAMNLVFSFDSILSAIALTDNFWVMAIAIIISGLLMIFLADHVAEFLKKNRMYEVLGLFILLIVGVMLVTEGGHLAHLHFFQYEITPMSKTTFYFVLAIMVGIDIVQSRYQKKLKAKRQAELKMA